MFEEILMRSTAWEKTRVGRLVLILLSIPSLAVSAAESPRPVFIRAACDGKVSSIVLSSLREEIRTSREYELASTLDDNGRMDEVHTIYMSCTERKAVAAVATNYGLARCLSGTNCHSIVDGSSIRSDLCDASAAEECGRALFKAFDDYISNPNAPRLKLK